jgi:hypothetical protein
MSPIRSPSPFQASDPGDALLSSSISLEGGAAVSAQGPTVTSKLPKAEIIMLKSEHLYPNAVNGVTRYRAVADLLKRLASVGVSAVVGGAGVPEDENSSSAVPEEGGGTLSMILSTKKAIFDEALAGLETLSKSVYIKAFVDPDQAGESSSSLDEVIRRVEKAGLLSWDGEGGDSVHDNAVATAAADRGLGSGFVLINLSNDLCGEGQGFLQMQVLDEDGHDGDIDVCYSGSGF